MAFCLCLLLIQVLALHLWLVLPIIPCQLLHHTFHLIRESWTPCWILLHRNIVVSHSLKRQSRNPQNKRFVLAKNVEAQNTMGGRHSRDASGIAETVAS